MKYIMRELKGTFGYIRKQTLFEAVKTVVLFAMALGIFMIGYKTLGTKKSLWSVFAILALLPASKSLVGLIMLLRFRSLPESDFPVIREKTIITPTIHNITFFFDIVSPFFRYISSDYDLIPVYPHSFPPVFTIREHRPLCIRMNTQRSG